MLQYWQHATLTPPHERGGQRERRKVRRGKNCSMQARTTPVYYTRWTVLCPGLPGWAGTRKVKRFWILLKQETVSGSGISWAICKSAPCSRQITTPAPHRSVFLQAGCPSCRPTNSVKALQARNSWITSIIEKISYKHSDTADRSHYSDH